MPGCVRESIMSRWKFVCLLVGVVGVSGISLAGSDAPDEEDKAFDDSALLKEVEELVTKFYPKSKVERKDGDIQFGYKTRVFKIHTPDLEGVWQNAHDERGPQPGGIYGEISLSGGRIESMAGLPQTFDLHYYKSRLMGHYSRKLDCTIHAEVRYPYRGAKGSADAKPFVEAFEELVNHFDKYVRKRMKEHKFGAPSTAENRSSLPRR